MEFLLILFCLIIIEVLSSNIKKVLVLGGTGRVGSIVVEKLLRQGIETNVIVRDFQKASLNPSLQGANLYHGDCTSLDDLLKTSEGCQAIVSVHGVSPPRLSKISDLFTKPTSDANHPYNVNYLAIKRILAAMEINKIPKLIRLTGSLAGKSPFIPFIALFNILLSRTVKWHERAEIAIRESGIDYTIVKPPEIENESSLHDAINNGEDKKSTKRHLTLGTMDNGALKGLRRISKYDVAEFCCRSLFEPRLKKVSVIISTAEGTGETEWGPILQATELAPDKKNLCPGPHNLAVITYLLGASALVASVLRASWMAANIVLKYLLKGQTLKSKLFL